MEREIEPYIKQLENAWNKVSYYLIPDKVKEDRKFKDEYNKLKLKNGPLKSTTNRKHFNCHAYIAPVLKDTGEQ